MDSYVSSLTHSLELHGKNPELNLEHSTCVKGGLTLGLNLAPSPPPPPKASLVLRPSRVGA